MEPCSEQVSEEAWVSEFMSLTGCTELQARSAFMYVCPGEISANGTETQKEAIVDPTAWSFGSDSSGSLDFLPGFASKTTYN